jgi:hypothetical protein
VLPCWYLLKRRRVDCGPPRDMQPLGKHSTVQSRSAVSIDSNPTPTESVTLLPVSHAHYGNQSVRHTKPKSCCAYSPSSAINCTTQRCLCRQPLSPTQRERGGEACIGDGIHGSSLSQSCQPSDATSQTCSKGGLTLVTASTVAPAASS